MMCIRHWAWVLFAAVMLPAVGIAQPPKQAATVIYDHRGGNNPHVSTQIGSEVTLGGPGRIRVPTGQAACFSVRRFPMSRFSSGDTPSAATGWRYRTHAMASASVRSHHTRRHRIRSTHFRQSSQSSGEHPGRTVTLQR